MRYRFEMAVSDTGRWLSDLNDRAYGRKPERWDRATWRFVDRIAGRLIVFGER